MTEPMHAVLDSRQALRIEAVHRGFLYQHLYAVGCLFLAEKNEAAAVVIESDEDIEIVTSTQRLYVQVKTRSSSIVPSDIDDVLLRFASLRVEHTEKRRQGIAVFIIVVNTDLGQKLAKITQSGGIPSDVHILFPGHTVADVPEALPPAWSGIPEAIQWCVAVAETLPYALLTPESLVWKLAGHVLLAASGGVPYTDHTFRAETLPSLFEQLLIQLQDFPTPPALYRPQTGEPSLNSELRVRIICGFSGAGKTVWASQAALHISQECTYFDVGDMPGPAIIPSLVREIAAKFSKQAPGELQKILLPGATGEESLRLLDTHMSLQGLRPVIVLDNAHRVPADNLHSLIRVTTHLRFVLLCQPSPTVQELEAILGLASESLLGWDIDSVAAEVAHAGGQGSAATFQRLLTLTAGLPLYIQSATRISVNEYDGDVAQLCIALETQTNITVTAQEIILARVFDSLSAPIRDAVAILSLSDISLTNPEVQILLRKALGMVASATASSIRTLRPTGVVQVFGNQQIKIHDAVRVLGRRHLGTFDPAIVRLARESLKDILFESLNKQRDTSRFSLYIRMLVALGDIKTLVDLATEELFHEMGLGNEILESLEVAAASSDIDTEQRFWALDGLVFAELKAGSLEKLPQRFTAMEQLLETNTLGGEEKLAFMMKRMLFQSNIGGADQVLASLATISEILPDKPDYQRIFRYNAAYALWRLNRFADAELIVREVIAEYFDILGITPQQVIGRNPPELWPLLTKTSTTHDDAKHLADGLELYALAVNRQGRDAGLSRIHAMKFYAMAGAFDSLIRVGQDLADDFIGRGDFETAREVIEKNVLPPVLKCNMIERIIAVRSQYAVILAYCGNHDGAEEEMARLLPYISGASQQQRSEIEAQRHFIDQLRRRVQTGNANSLKHRKIGRNEPCHCGSGLKYKKCHLQRNQ